tara:strand:+ start:227 stop:586 length:360 start_codon:yes stop_codon:yes gene_type:complete
MNEQLIEAIGELEVFLAKSKRLNIESRDLLLEITNKEEEGEFEDMARSHLPIIADKYKYACKIKEDYGDYTIKYKSLIDSMGEDIIKVSRDTAIGIDTMVNIIGKTLRKLIEINRRLKQ